MPIKIAFHWNLPPDSLYCSIQYVHVYCLLLCMYSDVQVGEGRELLVTATGAVPLPLRVRQLRGETTDIRLHPVQVRPVCMSVVALFPGLSHLRFWIAYSLQNRREGLGDPVVCDIMYLWMECASTVHVLTEILHHKLLMCTYIQLYMYMYQHLRIQILSYRTYCTCTC